MDSDECIHGLGPVSACVLCNGRALREAAARRNEWRIFPAKFEGQCPECDLPIAVGQQVAWKPDHPARHESCVN